MSCFYHFAEAKYSKYKKKKKKKYKNDIMNFKLDSRYFSPHFHLIDKETIILYNGSSVN